MRRLIPSLLLCLLAPVLTSCAWNREELLRMFKGKERTDEAQLKKVGVKEEDLSKFAVKDEAPAPPPEKQPVAEPPKPAPVTKARTAVIPAPVIRSAPAKAAPVAPAKPTDAAYPADYPEELKAVDAKAAGSWALFRPTFRADEKMMLDVDYLGMTVGKVVLRYRGLKTMSEKPVHHFQAFFKSAPFYSAIYELDDQLDTFVAADKFVGLRSNLVQRESKQNVDEVQLYDRETLRTTAYQKLVRDGKTKNKKWEEFMPRWSIDPLSVLWLIRGMPLKERDVYYLPLVNKGKTLVLEATVEGREKIKTKAGEFSTIRVRAFTQYTGKTLKSGDMTFWLSDDEQHTLLRAKTKIKIGSVFAEITPGS